MNDLVTSNAIAKHFGVTVGTINRWVRDNRIPYVRPSRRIVRFRIKEVEAALAIDVCAPSSGDRKGIRTLVARIDS